MNSSHLLGMTFSDCLKSLNLETFIITPTTPKEVSGTIKTLNSGKSTVPNSIPTKIMKTVKDEIRIPLSNLINKSFNIGVFLPIVKHR